MTPPTLFLLAALLHLASAVWMTVYAGLDAAWSAVTEWHSGATR